MDYIIVDIKFWIITITANCWTNQTLTHTHIYSSNEEKENSFLKYFQSSIHIYTMNKHTKFQTI